MITLGVWKNRKTGNDYLVTGVRTNCTNDQDGQVMVEYFSKEGNFCREIVEFQQKFELIEPAKKRVLVEDEPYATRVAGTSFYQKIVKAIDAGWRVRLVREPSNPHDERAIRVDAYETIGYIPRKENAPFAELMDVGREVRASIRSVGRSHDKMPEGVLINLVVVPMEK